MRDRAWLLSLILIAVSTAAHSAPPSTQTEECRALDEAAGRQRDELFKVQVKLRHEAMLQLAPKIRKLLNAFTNLDRKNIRKYETAFEKYTAKEDALCTDARGVRQWAGNMPAETRKALIEYAAKLKLPTLARDVDAIYQKKLAPLMAQTNEAVCVGGTPPTETIETYSGDPWAIDNPTSPFVQQPSQLPKNFELLSCNAEGDPKKVESATLIVLNKNRYRVYDLPEGVLYGPGTELSIQLAAKKFRVASDYAFGSDSWQVSEWGPCLDISLSDNLKRQLGALSRKALKKNVTEALEHEMFSYTGYLNTPAEVEYVSKGCNPELFEF